MAKKAKQERLDGVEFAKDIVIDRCCGRIREQRDAINEAMGNEKVDKAKALARMKEKGLETYKAHGVELVHTTTDKLRVRLIDDDEAGDATGEQGDLGKEE